jgi:hypothetical protein
MMPCLRIAHQRRANDIERHAVLQGDAAEDGGFRGEDADLASCLVARQKYFSERITVGES